MPGRAAICLTGGSSPKRLYQLLATDAYRSRIPWDRVHWFIGDDRFVAADDPLNNMAMARRLFLDACAPADTIHPIPTDAADPEDAARRYESELKSYYGFSRLNPARPLFDLVLMGVGPDGHTASLFPGYPAVDETERWVVGVPQAHVEPFVPRVTLTLPVLGSCHEMLFEAAGADKRAILTRVFDGEDLPANRVCSHGRASSGWWIKQRCRSISVADETDNMPCALVVMGVSGSGKSTIADRLAERLGWTYEDGDRFHPASNVAKMSAGHPLTDEDRWPWLQAIADEIDRVGTAGEHAVIACSALKRAYRDILVHGRDDVRIVFLSGSQQLIAGRLATRKGHFMPPGLLASQFATLEPPDESENPVTVSIDASVDAIVDDIIRQLGTEPRRQRRAQQGPSMTRIALVVSDVDGTLLTKDKTLTEGAKAAVRLLNDAGIGFTLISSRPTVGMRFLIEPLAITLPFGAFNGSSIVDAKFNPIEQHLLPAATAQTSLDVLDEFGVDIWLFTNELWLTRNADGEYVPHERRAIRADPTIVTDFTPYLPAACKVVGASSDAALLQRCEAAMQQALGGQATAVRSQSYYLDVTPPGHDKGTFVAGHRQAPGYFDRRRRHHRRHAERSADVQNTAACRSRWATRRTTSRNWRRMSRHRTRMRGLRGRSISSCAITPARSNPERRVRADAVRRRRPATKP